MKGKAAVTREGVRGMAITRYEVPEPGPDEVLAQLTMSRLRRAGLHMWPGVRGPGPELESARAPAGAARRVARLQGGRPGRRWHRHLRLWRGQGHGGGPGDRDRRDPRTARARAAVWRRRGDRLQADARQGRPRPAGPGADRRVRRRR